MGLKFVILATAAEISGEGKLSMLGGDFGGFKVAVLPALCPSISAAVKLYASPEEWGHPQAIDFSLTSPTGEVLGGSQIAVTPVVNQLYEGEDSEVGVIATFVQITLAVPGRYRVRVSSGGQTIGEASFNVALLMPDQPVGG